MKIIFFFSNKTEILQLYLLYYSDSNGFNPMTPFRPKTQRGIGLFQQRIEQQSQSSTSFSQFSGFQKSKTDTTTNNNETMASLLSTPVIVRKKPSSVGKFICF